MIEKERLLKHQKVQDIARDTIQHLCLVIVKDFTEEQIAHEAEKFLKSNGIKEFWYYNVGAFVFVGERTTLSLSGKNYTGPTQTAVQREDIVTIDLSPAIDGIWGDFARTLIVSGGKVIGVDSVDLEGKNSKHEFYQGIKAGEHLHAKLQNVVTAEMTFGEIFETMNAEIQSLGFENLDFHGNVGHTIVTDKEERDYVKSGSRITVSQAGLFTFEPHIRKKEGKYGFKREDIYYFENGKLVLL